MELTSGIIFNRLSKNFHMEYSQTLKQNRIRVIYFDEHDIYENGHLYILNDNYCPEICFSTKSTAVFIILGAPIPIPSDCPADFLFCTDVIDCYKIMNALNAIFLEFNDWEAELYQCPCTPEGVHQLLVLSKRYLRGRMSLSDIYLNYVMRNSKSPSSASGKTITNNFRIVDEEEINDLINDPEFYHFEKEPGVFLYSAIDYTVLCFNLFQNERFCYRLIYNNFKNVYSDEEYYLFEYIGNHVRDLIAYIPSMTAPIPFNSPIRNSIYHLISGAALSSILIQEQLSQIGWNNNDEYMLIYMSHYFINSEYDAPLQHALQLEHRYKESIAIKYQKGLLFLLNLTQNPLLNNYLFFSSFSVFIRDTMYKCGISTIIKDFMKLQYALDQADFALSYGLSHHDTLWYFKFEDYYLEYIIEKAIEKLPVEFICHPGILKLKEYDSINQTGFYHTLFVYLQYAHNLNEVARLLHVHRTTLLYRIEKIEKICDVDLKDWKTKTHLMMSYLILGEK